MDTPPLASVITDDNAIRRIGSISCAMSETFSALPICLRQMKAKGCNKSRSASDLSFFSHSLLHNILLKRGLFYAHLVHCRRICCHFLKKYTVYYFVPQPLMRHPQCTSAISHPWAFWLELPGFVSVTCQQHHGYPWNIVTNYRNQRETSRPSEN